MNTIIATINVHRQNHKKLEAIITKRITPKHTEELTCFNKQQINTDTTSDSYNERLIKWEKY